MAYDKQTWVDYPSTSTPITAARLNHIEQGIYDASASGGVTEEKVQEMIDASIGDVLNGSY